MKKEAIMATSRAFFTGVAKLKANSPHIMFGVGVVGVIGGAVLASRATLHVEKHLHEAQMKFDDIKSIEHPDYTDSEQLRDRAVVLAEVSVNIIKLYGPAIIVGGIGIGCLTGAHVTLSKRNVALATAYAALERSYNAYRRQIREEFGEEREAQAHRFVQKRILEEDMSKQIESGRAKSDFTPSSYARFFDESNPNWKPVASYNLNFLECQQNYHNQMLISRGHVLLNDVYESLGFPRTSAGAVVGWVHGNGDNYVDFGVFNPRSNSARSFVNTNDPVILLDFNVDGVIYNMIDWRSRG